VLLRASLSSTGACGVADIGWQGLWEPNPAEAVAPAWVGAVLLNYSLKEPIMPLQFQATVSDLLTATRIWQFFRDGWVQ